MEHMNLGQISRKTGLKARQNTKLDEHGMEVIEDFFVDSPDSSSEDEKVRVIKNGIGRIGRKTEPPLNRRLDFNTNSPLLSPLRPSSVRRGSSGEQSMELDSIHYDSPPMDDRERYLKNLEQLSPDSDLDEAMLEKMKGKVNLSRGAAGITRNIALGKRRRKPVVTKDKSKKPVKRPAAKAATNPSTKPQASQTSQTPKSQKGTEPLRRTPQRARSINKENQLVARDPSQPRRSSRTRIQPLAHWRNERVIYRPVKGDDDRIAHEVERIVHIPQDPVTTHNAVSRKRKSTSKPSQELTYESDPEIEGSEWYKDGNLEASVFEGPGSDNKVKRTIAWAPNREKYLPPIRNDKENFKISILFDQDKEFTASGMIEIPMNSVKSLKSNDDTYFIFFVIKGLLQVTVSENVFIVGQGCSFEVPMGNFYEFVNKGKSAAKLFFVQSKYVTLDPEQDYD